MSGHMPKKNLAEGIARYAARENVDQARYQEFQEGGLWDLAAMGGWVLVLLTVGGREGMGQWAAYKWYSLCEAI